MPLVVPVPPSRPTPWSRLVAFFRESRASAFVVCFAELSSRAREVVSLSPSRVLLWLSKMCAEPSPLESASSHSMTLAMTDLVFWTEALWAATLTLRAAWRSTMVLT